MNCPRCGSTNHCKDGVIKGRQRYKCKDCRYHYTVEQRSNAKPKEIKRLALEMYLEGLGVRAIGRMLQISYGTVFYWEKNWGKDQYIPERNKDLKVVEPDELYAYVGKKKITTGYGLLLIDIENGTTLLSGATVRFKRDLKK